MAESRVEKPVKFRPYPKVVFLWPIGAAALLISIGSLIYPSGFTVKAPKAEVITEAMIENHAELAEVKSQLGSFDKRTTGRYVNHYWGNFFFLLFFLNVLVLAYDFDVTKGVAAFLGILALVLLILYLNQTMKIWEPLSNALAQIRISFNLHYMYAMTLMGLVTALAILAHAQFNWWELTHNELIHRKRFLGDIKRYPAQHCRLMKEIPDVMEYFFFFGCGRLVFQIPGEQRAFVLEHVPLVNRRERQIKEKLGSLSIRHESPDYTPEPGI